MSSSCFDEQTNLSSLLHTNTHPRRVLVEIVLGTVLTDPHQRVMGTDLREKSPSNRWLRLPSAVVDCMHLRQPPKGRKIKMDLPPFKAPY